MALFEHADTLKAQVEAHEGLLEVTDLNRDLAPEVPMTNNYPDLVPRTCSRKLSLRELPDDNSKDVGNVENSSSNVMSENFFLLAILLGTCILLYFFPPGP